MITPVPRVLVIGLDGATWTNLLPLAERGDMPTLQRLLREGAWGNLDSTVPALTPPAWTSLVTGTNPGKHGIYHFRHTPPGDYYQRRLNTARDIHSQTLWQRLGAHGKQVGVINVPLCHPVYPVNGFMTSDAFAPEPGVRTHPPELAVELKEYIVDVVNYPTALPGTAHYEQEMLAFIDENERVMLSQIDAAIRLMQTKPWQFFMIALMATDRLGHYCWKFSDPALESSLASDEQKRIGMRCRTLYRQIDTQLARFLDTVGPECAVVIASDHGFGAAPPAFFHTNRWLLDRGYLQLLPAYHWKRLLHGYLPRSWKAKLRSPVDSKYGLVDWRGTRVWADPLEARAVAIHINRTGHYPAGVVIDSEYEPLLATLERELRALRTPQGGKVFAEIHRRESLFRGPHAEPAPDLVCILAKEFDVPASFRRDVRSTGLITLNRHVLRDGGHEPEGIFLLHGPNVRATGRLPSQPIVAIAPTVLQMFGLPIPDDIDCQPITAAFSEPFLRANPSRRESEPGTPATTTPAEQADYSEEDSAKVEERLRKLGYLD